MKMVINTNYGGFCVPEELIEGGYIHRLDRYSNKLSIRTNHALINWVIDHPDNDLAIVEIPDEATDFELNEYDGFESIIAVVGGKILHICGDEDPEEEDLGDEE